MVIETFILTVLTFEAVIQWTINIHYLFQQCNDEEKDD